MVDQSVDIRNMVQELENNILSGLLLVISVLFIFLGLTNSLFVALAIPLSMLISFVALQAIGFTLNMVVLFSLILALGMLVEPTSAVKVGSCDCRRPTLLAKPPVAIRTPRSERTLTGEPSLPRPK